MPQYMKKGSLGRLVPADSISDPDLCEVRLSKEEYEDICWRLESAEVDLALARDRLEDKEMEVAQAREEADQALERIERVKKEAKKKNDEVITSANRQLDIYRVQINQEAEKRISVAEQAVLDLKKRMEISEETTVKLDEDLRKQIYLNRNLIRIARERANADRGITPKKEHDGYLVLSSRQWVERYEHELTEEEYIAKSDEFKEKHRFPYKEHLTADVWKSVIQTPYDASLPISQIGPVVEKDDFWGNGVLSDIGCTKKLKREYNGKYRDFGYDEDGYKINGLYKWVYNANYKTGFWEIDIYTTGSLRVPPERRPEPIYKKKPSKKKKKESEKQNEAVYEFDDNDDYI